MAKVIRGGNMFFEDDIKIIDAELEKPMALPQPLPVVSRDELQIFYNGRIYLAVRSSGKNHIKVYTLEFGLEETESPKVQEDRYFADNSGLIKKLSTGFVSSVMAGISILNIRDAQALSSELINRINQKYNQNKQPASGAKANDGSVFNSEINSYERVLVLDGKVYDLLTIPEYVSVFEKAFDKTFYASFQEACRTLTPEEISKMIDSNKDKVHRKALPLVRNKIWHSERSGRLYLDGAYLIPQFRGKLDDLKSQYQRFLEKKVKIDAAGGIK